MPSRPRVLGTSRRHSVRNACDRGRCDTRRDSGPEGRAGRDCWGGCAARVNAREFAPLPRGSSGVPGTRAGSAYGKTPFCLVCARFHGPGPCCGLVIVLCRHGTWAGCRHRQFAPAARSSFGCLPNRCSIRMRRLLWEAMATAPGVSHLRRFARPQRADGRAARFAPAVSHPRPIGILASRTRHRRRRGAASAARASRPTVR